MPRPVLVLLYTRPVILGVLTQTQRSLYSTAAQTIPIFLVVIAIDIRFARAFMDTRHRWSTIVALVVLGAAGLLMLIGEFAAITVLSSDDQSSVAKFLAVAGMWAGALLAGSAVLAYMWQRYKETSQVAQEPSQASPR